jgi:hypothetical protein
MVMTAIGGRSRLRENDRMVVGLADPDKSGCQYPMAHPMAL